MLNAFLTQFVAVHINNLVFPDIVFAFLGLGFILFAVKGEELYVQDGEEYVKGISILVKDKDLTGFQNLLGLVKYNYIGVSATLFKKERPSLPQGNRV